MRIIKERKRENFLAILNGFDNKRSKTYFNIEDIKNLNA